MIASQATRSPRIARPRWAVRRRAEAAAIAAIVLATAAAASLAADLGWPAWAVMWILAGGTFLVCKALSCFVIGRGDAPAWRRAAYWMAWPGLDAAAFLAARAPDARVQRPTRAQWTFALLKTACGIAIFLTAGGRLVDAHPLAGGWLAMIGLVLALHFGLFHVLSCAWRAAGVDAAPLMNRPLAAASVAEFWTRWNTAFRDLAQAVIFRPVVRRWGAGLGLAAAFLGSGLVHDLVISVPARAGYGGPTAYFLLQAAAIASSRSAWGRRLRISGGAGGWLFTMTVVAAPLPLLFPAPFVLQVAAPFAQAVARTIGL